MPDIWVFLDESGTHAKAERLLVGAVVVSDREAVESAVTKAAANLAGTSGIWSDSEEIEAFLARGFHFTQDTDSVRTLFVSRLGEMNIRVHAAYSASGNGDAWRTRAAAMYYQLVRAILARYRRCTVHFVFERETGMNRLYPGIVELAAQSVVGDGNAASWNELEWDVSIGGKDDPALGVVDYVLATLSLRLSVMRQGEFQARWAQSFAGHVAHLLDYDKALRYSSRASTLPLAGAGGHDGRARVAPGSRMSQHDPMTPQSPPPVDVVTGVPVLAPKHIGVDALPSVLGCSPAKLSSLLERLAAGGCYSVQRIWMKGRQRRVEIPDEELKGIQRRIFDYLSRMELDLPFCVHGYVKGRSHISNATAHVGRRHLQKFDLKDFFPSVTREAVTAVLAEAGFTRAAVDRLGRLLTYKDRLPLGAPTSPLLSNLCLRPLDAALQALAAERGLVYTRYSDDLTFSANGPFDVRAEVKAIVSCAGFRLNRDKTVTARYGQALYVTGLSTSDAAGPRLPKRFKRKLRQDMYLIDKYGIDSYAEWGGEERYGRPGEDPFHAREYAFRAARIVEGKLRYARAVEPSFFDRLESEFREAYLSVMRYPSEDNDVGYFEKSLMAALARPRPAAPPYQGTKHYSSIFSEETDDGLADSSSW